MMYLYVDIETLPAADRESVPAPKAPSNYKDPEKIAAYIEEHREEAYRATALDPLAGRILCIGYAFDDEPAAVLYADDGDEEALIARFADVVHEAATRAHGSLGFVGHNLAGFDLRFLWFRALAYGEHSLARALPWHVWQRPWLSDTMIIAGGPTRERVSLAKLASYFHLGGKGEGMSGAEVYPAYLRGEHDRIREYCRRDVELVREVHNILAVSEKKPGSDQ